MQTQYVLFQVANSKGSIQSSDGATYVRIHGFFSTKTRAQMVAKAFDADVRVAPTCAWNILLNSKESDPEREKTHFEALMEAYQSQSRKNYEDVFERAQTKSCPEIPFVPTKKESCTTVSNASEISGLGDAEDTWFARKKFTNEFTTESKTCSLPPGQNVCVFAAVPDIFNQWRYNDLLQDASRKVQDQFEEYKASVAGDSSIVHDRDAYFQEHMKLPDEIPGDEPLLDFLGVFESESKAKEFLDSYKDLKEFPRACVAMGNWVRIRDIHTADVQRYYQDDTLQLFMDSLRKAKKE